VRSGSGSRAVEQADLLALHQEFCLRPHLATGREAAPRHIGLGHDQEAPWIEPRVARHRPAEHEVVAGVLGPLFEQDRLGWHSLLKSHVGEDPRLALVPAGIEQAAAMGDAARHDDPGRELRVPQPRRVDHSVGIETP
jgi:hypothetical protein